MTSNGSYPLYIKLANIAIGVFIFFYVVHIGRPILVPLVYAGIFAILLNPVVNWLTHKKMNRVIAIMLTVVVAIIVVGTLVYFISTLLSTFTETLPQFKEKFAQLLKQTYQWVSDTFSIKTKKIYAYVEQAKTQGMDNSGAVIGTTLSTLGSILAVVFLVPVYTFMFLFYKPLLLDFISQLFSREKHNTVVEVLSETKKLIQSYLTGLMLELVIITVLNSAALLIIGVDYAILLGIVGALLNIIPYIGGLVAITLAGLVALATQSPEAAGWVVLAYVIIQLVDNNFIMPMIVASKVKLNALLSIIVVLIGGALWGIPGMFLSIPITAIAKVIFDRIDQLKPWGFLLGDTMPPIGKTTFHFGHHKKKPKSSTAKAE